MSNQLSGDAGERHDWTRAEAEALYQAPFNDLLFLAQTVHRHHFHPNQVQMSSLLSVKTGGCPEDCAYCGQSAHYKTGLSASKLMEVERVIEEARKAKAAGATRYCMGAAWKNPKERDFNAVLAMVEGVKALGMETCMTLGSLTQSDAKRLKGAGLDYYNHNIDTSERYYSEIVTTRTFDERLDTLGMCVRRGSRSAAAALSAWANARTTGWICWSRWRICRNTPKACRSTC